MRKTAVVLFTLTLMLTVGCSKDPAERCAELEVELEQVNTEAKKVMGQLFQGGDKDELREKTKELAEREKEIKAEMRELGCSQYE